MERFEETIVLTNSNGLHVRPAAVFVQLASKYDSTVNLEKDGESVDGKSIIAILSLGLNCGSSVTLIVDGDDAQEAFPELKKFLETNHAEG